MSAFAALVLTNSAAANVTFNPLTIDSTGIASYATSDAIYDAKSFVSISSKVPNARSTKARFKGKVTVPLMDPVDPTKKIDEAIAAIDIAFPKNMGLTQRLDLKAYVDSLVSNAILTAFATSFEGIY